MGRGGRGTAPDYIEYLTPTADKVKLYRNKWRQDKAFMAEEKAIRWLFRTYPQNTDLNQIMIKCAAFVQSHRDDDIYKMARHIKTIPFDELIKNDDLSFVTEIAKIHWGKGGRRRVDESIYMLATRYCAYHKPKSYPLLNACVEEMLLAFRERKMIKHFEDKDLFDYVKFTGIMQCLVDKYTLQEFNFTEIALYFERFLPDWEEDKCVFE